METQVYRQSYVLPVEEDSHHEFKGHRNLAVEELPRWCFVRGGEKKSRPTRAPVSRTLNGFLNTGKGGTVYLGVTDDGIVKGIYLSTAQIEHVRVSLADLMSRYSPRVPKSRYKVKFCPVSSMASSLNDSGYCSGSEGAEATASVPTKQPPRPHVLRTSTYCWCDKAALALYSQGIEMPTYIIKVTILPFVPNKEAHTDILQLHPVYENEEGRCYFRRAASTKSVSHQDVAELTRLETRNHFEKLLRRQRHILSMYQNLYTSMILCSTPCGIPPKEERFTSTQND